jgi:SAM-dependent methyltransferase
MPQSSSTSARLPFECRVFQSYVRGLKFFWKEDLYRTVVKEAARQPEASTDALEARMRDEAPYQLYAWLERRLQQFKYLGRWGLVPTLAADAERLGRILASVDGLAPERLQLDAKLQIPDYVAEVDTHQHPGSTWSDDYDAFVHESATAGFSFALGDAEQLDARYAGPLAQFAPRRILDLGCSTGKSTRALKRVMPEAEVAGCDVGAPVLRLAHLRALEAGLDITYCQQNAEHLRFADASFDLVASHWLFHELPPAAIRNTLRESHRVLRSGGHLAVYDMCGVPGGVVGRWLHRGYSARNNEPFADALARLDLAAELAAAGFEDVRFDPPLPGPGHEGRLAPARANELFMVTARRA